MPFIDLYLIIRYIHNTFPRGMVLLIVGIQQIRLLSCPFFTAIDRNDGTLYYKLTEHDQRL